MAYAWEAVVIGLVGGSIAVLVPVFLEWMRIDDPVGVVPVHCACSIWGMLSVGLFVDDVSFDDFIKIPIASTFTCPSHSFCFSNFFFENEREHPAEPVSSDSGFTLCYSSQEHNG